MARMSRIIMTATAIPPAGTLPLSGVFAFDAPAEDVALGDEFPKLGAGAAVTVLDVDGNAEVEGDVLV